MTGLVAIGIAAIHAADVAPRMLLLDGAAVGTDLVVVGERGTILRSGDQAKTWQRIPTPAAATLTGVSFAADKQHGWAVGHDALILATADAGRTWAKQFQGENLQDSFLDVLALDAQRVIAVGAYGLCVMTNDGGKTWKRHKLSEDDYHFNRLTRGESGTFYIAGEHGTLLRLTDNGATWKKLTAPYDGSFYGILPLGHHTLLAYGLRGHVYRSVDDGATWEPVAMPQPVLLATAARLKGDTIVIAGQARPLFVSHDEAKTFTRWSPTSGAGVAELVELPDGALLALGEAGATVLPKP